MLKGKKKKQLHAYCYELSKLLVLENLYLDYYYFSSMDVEKRKKFLESNYTKRNVGIRKTIQAYEKDHATYRQKKRKEQEKYRMVEKEEI